MHLKGQEFREIGLASAGAAATRQNCDKERDRRSRARSKASPHTEMGGDFRAVRKFAV
jgi:hypothetical protein